MLKINYDYLDVTGAIDIAARRGETAKQTAEYGCKWKSATAEQTAEYGSCNYWG